MQVLGFGVWGSGVSAQPQPSKLCPLHQMSQIRGRVHLGLDVLVRKPAYICVYMYI